MMGVPAHLSVVASEVPRLSASATVDEAARVLQKHGALVVERALDPLSLATVSDELHPWFQKALTGEGAFFGRSTKRFSGLFAKAPSTAALAIHDLVLPVAERLLTGDGHADTIELNLTQAIGIGPGEPPQFLHRDDELWPCAHDRELMFNAMWALDPFTVENGATRLIPGSHRWARDMQPLPGQALPADCPAGSVILWLGSVLHGGGANHTNQVRRGVVMSYRLGWLAPAEKLLLSTSPSVARALPEKLQRLIGYQIHRPNLGWVEGRDPIEWLRGEFEELASPGDNLTSAHEELLCGVATNPEAFAGYIS